MKGCKLIFKYVGILFVLYLIISILIFLFGHGELNKEYRKQRNKKKEEDIEIKEIILTETSNPPKVVTVKINKTNKTKEIMSIKDK